MTLPEDAITRLTRTGLNLIQQAISIFDSDLKLVVSNKRYQEMFDFPDEFVRSGVDFERTIRFLVNRGEYGPVDTPEEAIQQRVRAARAFVPHYMERMRPNGRWVSVEGFPLPEGGWVTVYTDITEVRSQQMMLRARSAELSEELLSHSERLSEANRALSAAITALEATKIQLTESEARMRLTTEMMPAHIAHVDRDLRYTYTNRRLSSVIPGSPSQIIGMTGVEALGPRNFAKIEAHLKRALAGQSSVMEFSDEESGRRIRSAFTPDRTESGPINGVYILSMDITEETQARAAVAQTRKRELAAQLTSGLAHDFANLLTIILGLQSRLNRLPLPAEARELVASTLAATRRGGTLLDRIASISGKRELRPSAVNMAAFLADLAVLARSALPDGVKFVYEVAGLDVPVVLDLGGLQDALLHLILNAKDAIGDRHGQIDLVVRPVHDTWIEFIVTDSGPGFSQKALEHGLDPFFTTKGGAGSGLGLSMVYDQTLLAGGTMQLGNGPNGGARVQLRLPYRLAAPAARGLMVLLVEDMPDLREQLRDMICSLGHRVIEAATADEALSLAGLPGIDLVLSDLRLPGDKTGLDLANDLAAALGPRVALMTSLPQQDRLRQNAMATYPLIAKPFTLSELTAFLAAVIQ